MTVSASQLPDLNLPRKPVYVKLESGIDFFRLFQTIETECENCFFLESLGEGDSDSRYSVIGFDPDAIVRGLPGRLVWKPRVGDQIEIASENPYDTLAQWMPQNIISRNYSGGLVGYLNYEAMNFFEPVLALKPHADFDPFRFGVYTDGLVLDKMTGEVFYVFFDADRSERVRAWLAAPPPGHADLSVRPLGQSRTEEQYHAMVAETIEEIRKGNTFQCQIGLYEDYEFTGHPMAVYQALREVNPSPHMFYLKFEDRLQIGASPELIFRLRQGEMETYPLAGTTKRGANAEEDILLARELLNDPKEIAEHNMLVDLHRNDLGRVARFGTVKVRRLMDAKKFSHVQHISSEVVGIIRKDCDMFSGLKSVYPAGTLSGAPKIESMKIIERVEDSPRGPYGGAVGHFGWNGESTFAIPIRSLFLSGNRATVRAAAGIVFDSTPEGEYQEIQRKLAGMKKTLLQFAADGDPAS
ncbi:MAG: anthranilate synthase component I family protein [bacterium]|nr:anthranilate synthase component I family protein [bacterium]